jgi:hypothetical protein
MIEKTKRKNDTPRSRRPLVMGLMALLILIGMTTLMLTSLSAQSDPSGHLYYGYTVDPTVEAYYRADLAGGMGDYAAWPLPKETTVGYQAPAPTRHITRRIAWQAQSAGRQYNLVIRDAASGADLKVLAPFYPSYRYFPAPDASYSADGQWAVFTSTDHPAHMDSSMPRYENIWLVNLQTGDLKHLTDKGYDDVNPTFMMDGTSILYLSQSDGTMRLYRMDVASGTSQLMTAGLGRITDYTWSPDNTQISLLAEQPQAVGVMDTETQATFDPSVMRSLIVVNPITWAQRVVVSDTIYEHLWSPDGQWLAYATYDPMETLEERSYGGIMGVPSVPYYEEQPTSLWIIRTDGTDKQTISGARMRLHSLDWIP